MTNLSLDIYAVSCSTSLHGNYDLYSLAAVNILLSITAALGNIIILFALHKESSLHPPSKLLYLSLTMTDLLVGLFSHPLFVVHLLLIVDPQRVLYCCAFARISISDIAAQGEIRRFRISEILRKSDGSSFRHISGGRLRRETRKSKMRSCFAFPQRFRSVSVG